MHWIDRMLPHLLSHRLISVYQAVHNMPYYCSEMLHILSQVGFISNTDATHKTWQELD